LVDQAGVAIVGRVYTPNLGLERIILNVIANPAIRFLLVCGRESSVFHPGEALRALCADGVTAERRIIGAQGPFPVLASLPHARIELFRRQIEFIDYVGETDVEVLKTEIRALGRRNPGPFWDELVPVEPTRFAAEPASPAGAEGIVAIQPGGRREPLAYDRKGFFIITPGREPGEIVLRHYSADYTPAHEMRGRTAESMLLGLLREGLVSQLSHAGYLGAELAKAEAAARLGLRYEQDRPLRLAGRPQSSPTGA
jgi:tetrahydromethanopterin S-methyltransferase subunit A